MNEYTSSTKWTEDQQTKIDELMNGDLVNLFVYLLVCFGAEGTWVQFLLGYISFSLLVDTLELRVNGLTHAPTLFASEAAGLTHSTLLTNSLQCFSFC